MSTALVAGGSGLVGRKLINQLLDNNTYHRIILLGRRTIDLDHPKLEQVLIDFNNITTLETKVDVIFCCLGTTIKKAGSKEVFKKVDFAYPLAIAKAGMTLGAKAFHIITAMGANPNSGIFYSQVKGQVEEELRLLTYEQLHIYQPSLLLGKRQDTRFMESVSQNIMRILSFLFIGPLKNYKAINAKRVAQFMVTKSVQEKRGNFVYLSGEMQ